MGTLPNGLPTGIGDPRQATQATAWIRPMRNQRALLYALVLKG